MSPLQIFPHSSSYAQVPLIDFLSPQKFVRKHDRDFDSSYPRGNKEKRAKVYHSLPMFYEELLPVLIWNYGIFVIPAKPRRPHIQKDTMSMPYVNIMKDFEGISWRIARPSKTRFNPWSTQIRSNSKNLSVVIRSIKIKDQLGVIFVFLLIMNVFICECAFWDM